MCAWCLQKLEGKQYPEARVNPGSLVTATSPVSFWAISPATVSNFKKDFVLIIFKAFEFVLLYYFIVIAKYINYILRGIYNIYAIYTYIYKTIFHLYPFLVKHTQTSLSHYLECHMLLHIIRMRYICGTQYFFSSSRVSVLGTYCYIKCCKTPQAALSETFK